MFEEIYPKEVLEQLQKGVALHILDVREPGEYAGGHIQGAKLFPLGQIPGRFRELDRNLEYVIVCRSGARSSLACEWLTNQGFKVKNMIGGMLSWPGQVEY